MIAENPAALPRIMFASQWQVADFPSMIRTGIWPSQSDDVVLLERAPRALNNRAGSSGAQIAIETYRNTDVTIAVSSDAGGFVVLNDAWHPWWFAFVDETPVEMLRANVIFRAVQVPPGRHRVRFAFRPFAGAYDQIVRRMGF